MTTRRTWAEEEISRIHDRRARRTASQAATYRYLYSGPARRSRLRKPLFRFGVVGGLVGLGLLVAGVDGAAGFLLCAMLGGIFGDPRG